MAAKPDRRPEQTLALILSAGSIMQNAQNRKDSRLKTVKGGHLPSQYAPGESWTEMTRTDKELVERDLEAALQDIRRALEWGGEP